MNLALQILAPEHRLARIDVLEARGEPVELARVGEVHERRVDGGGLADAPHLPFEHQAAVVGDRARPAALGLLRDGIEPDRNIFRGLSRPSGARQESPG